MNPRAGRNRGRTPLGFLHNELKPDADVLQVTGIGDGLPVLIYSLDTGVLEAKAYHLPEKGLHQAGVAPLKDLSANGLNALQGCVRIAAYIGLEEFESGGENIFYVLKFANDSS